MLDLHRAASVIQGYRQLTFVKGCQSICALSDVLTYLEKLETIVRVNTTLCARILAPLRISDPVHTG